jgi:hypothetical protein
MKSLMKSIINTLLLDRRSLNYLWRKQKPIWYWNNREAVRLFREDRFEVDLIQKRLIKDLKETGIAVGHIDELFDDMLPAILKNNPINTEGKINSRKPYFTELSQSYYSAPNFVLDFGNPVIQVALSRKALDIVNGYLGMYSRFFEYSLARIEPTGKAPLDSQTWHRDAYDRKFVKMFIYLTDVDDDSGPFVYLKGSNPGGKWNKLYQQYGISTTYLPKDAKLPQDDIKICKGKAGTVIFCDTTGIHYGGYCKTNSRVMFTASYRTSGSPVAPNEKYYEVPANLKLTNPVIKYALYL